MRLPRVTYTRIMKKHTVRVFTWSRTPVTTKVQVLVLWVSNKTENMHHMKFNPRIYHGAVHMPLDLLNLVNYEW